MYGKRPPEADRERREHREDLAPEALVEAARARPASDLVEGTIRMPCSASAGRSSRSQQRVWRSARSRPPSRIASSVSPACAVLPRRLEAGVDLVVQAGHADHEELVEVVGDRAELHPLEQRHVRVLGELEHAVVELQPRQLAVEVQLGSSRSMAGCGLLGDLSSTALNFTPLRTAILTPASSMMTPSRKPPRPILSGRPSRGGPRVEHEQAPRASAGRARASMSKRAATSAERGEHPHARARRVASSRGPTRRRSERRCRRPRRRCRPGRVEALEDAVGVLAHRSQLGRVRRVAARCRRSAAPSRRGTSADHVAPPASVPTASSVEPPPTSTTGHAPSSGSPSVRIAPRKRAAPPLAVEHVDLDAAAADRVEKSARLRRRGSRPWPPTADAGVPCSSAGLPPATTRAASAIFAAPDPAPLSPAPIRVNARPRRPRGARPPRRRRPAGAWCSCRCRCRRQRQAVRKRVAMMAVTRPWVRRSRCAA